MEGNKLNSKEYELHFPNMPVYFKEAQKQGVPLKDFLCEKIYIDEEVIQELLKKWQPASEDYQEEPPSLPLEEVYAIPAKVKKSRDPLAVVFYLVGLVLPVLSTLLTQMFYLFETDFGSLIIFFLVYLCAGYVAAPKRGDTINGRMKIVYCVLPIGVILDASLHINLHDYLYDRNLLPFEIIFFMIIAPLPLWIGFFIRKIISKKHESA